MNKLSILYVVVIASLFSCRSASHFVTQEGGWILLAEKKVNHLNEKDVVEINSLDRFTALRLHAKDRDLQIKSIEITLINGDRLSPAIESKISKGQNSRVIELASEGRQIVNIRVKYRSEGNLFSKKGKVQFAGRPYHSASN